MKERSVEDEHSSIVEYIQLAYDWVNEHLTPAVQAAFRGERDAALASLEQGLAGLSSSSLPADLQDQVRVRGRYMRWQMECLGQPLADEARLRGELIAELESYHGSSYAETAVRAYLIQLRALAWRDSGVLYAHARFRADVDALPQWGRTLEVYIYIAACAFLHRDLELLEDAFTMFTMYSDGFMADYLWQRVNLMYQILKGAAQPRDFEELLRRIEHPHQWTDIERVLLPACIQAGLCRDDGVCNALGALLQELHSAAPDMPKRLNPTGRIRRD